MKFPNPAGKLDFPTAADFVATGVDEVDAAAAAAAAALTPIKPAVAAPE